MPKRVEEMTKEELLSALKSAMATVVLPLQRTVDAVVKYAGSLESKLVLLEHKVARIQAHIPTMQRLDMTNYRLAENDEQTKLSKDGDGGGACSIPLPTNADAGKECEVRGYTRSFTNELPRNDNKEYYGSVVHLDDVQSVHTQKTTQGEDDEC